METILKIIFLLFAYVLLPTVGLFVILYFILGSFFRKAKLSLGDTTGVDKNLRGLPVNINKISKRFARIVIWNCKNTLKSLLKNINPSNKEASENSGMFLGFMLVMLGHLITFIIILFQSQYGLNRFWDAFWHTLTILPFTQSIYVVPLVLFLVVVKYFKILKGVLITYATLWALLLGVLIAFGITFFAASMLCVVVYEHYLRL